MTMAKSSRKQGMQHEKNQGGCMQSLLMKLHTCNGRLTRKLLWDEGRNGHGISRSNSDLTTVFDANVQINPDGERTELIAIGGKPSVKTLMEEEMIIEANAESRPGKYRSKSLTHGKIGRFNQFMDDGECFGDDIRDILEYLSGLLWQRRGISGEHDEEEFSRILGKILSHQLSSGKQLTADEKLRRSKVLVTMLRMLNSDEFTILDPEVTVMKCMEILHESKLPRSISSGEDARDRFTMNVESSSVSSRIVILKPGMTELQKPGEALNASISQESKTNCAKVQKTKSGTPSFLSDIKRKLKTIVMKECPDLYAGKDTKRAGIKTEDTRKHEPARVSYQTKKYLSEAITDEDEDTSYPGQTAEIMGMILLYPELNCSPHTRPGRRWEHGAVNSPAGSSSRTNSQIVCNKWRKPGAVVLKESGPGITSLCASGSTHVERRGIEQQPSHRFPLPEMLLVIEEGDDDLKVAIDLHERPSPVSVLEPMLSDNDISPAVVKRVEFPRRPLEIELKEDDICITETGTYIRTINEDRELVLDQVRALLRASGLKWEELYLKSQSLDWLIQPRVLLHDQHFFKHDERLLVDCVNEALLEACSCFIGRSCLSLVKQRIKPVPSMDFTIHEVCRGVKWHLEPIPQPHSLEQIVGKDLSRRGSWMDLAFEGEGIGFDLCQSIFSELLQDIIISPEDKASEGTCQLRIRQLS